MLIHPFASPLAVSSVQIIVSILLSILVYEPHVPSSYSESISYFIDFFGGQLYPFLSQPIKPFWSSEVIPFRSVQFLDCQIDVYRFVMALSTAQDSPMGSSTGKQPVDHFQALVSDLSKILGASSGLTSEDVDVQELHERMETYLSDETEWLKYAFSDLSRGYTRNLVDEGNGKSNLVSPLRAQFSIQG
jgi:hypothetical protein